MKHHDPVSLHRLCADLAQAGAEPQEINNLLNELLSSDKVLSAIRNNISRSTETAMHLIRIKRLPPEDLQKVMEIAKDIQAVRFDTSASKPQGDPK